MPLPAVGQLEYSRTYNGQPTAPRIGDRYSKVKDLTASTEGPVFVVRSRRSGAKFVCKITEGRQRSTGYYEPPADWTIVFDILHQVHPNIINVFECEQSRTPGRFTIRMEFCSGGDLSRVVSNLRANGTPTPELLLLHVAKSLIYALMFMHSAVYVTDSHPHQTLAATAGVVLHNDLKPDQVFLRWSNSENCTKWNLPDIVLGDFGHATLATKPPRYPAQASFCPPERRRDRAWWQMRDEVGTASDIWTFGAMMAAVMCQENANPWTTPRYRIPRNVKGASFPTMLERCLLDDRKRRPTALDLLKDYVPPLRRRMQEDTDRGAKCPQWVYNA